MMRQCWMSLVLMISSMFLFSHVVEAQPATCTPLVEVAMAALDENCQQLERNNACYGHDSVAVTFSEPTEPSEATFSAPSDVVALAALATIETAALDEANEIWGVVLMRVQANLPQTLPGQNVTYVMMGDATMTPAEPVPAEEDAQSARPFQAFYFTTGVGNPNCTDSPDSLIIQSPAEATVELTVNDVSISLASTAFLSLVEDDEGLVALELTMADGQAVVDDALVVPEGHWARIPLDNDTLLDERWYTALPEAPFCRETPLEHRENFEGLLATVPDSLLAYSVDTITPDERGCHTPMPAEEAD